MIYDWSDEEHIEHKRRTGYPPPEHPDCCPGAGRHALSVRIQGRRIAGYWNPGRGLCPTCKREIRLETNDLTVARHWADHVLSSDRLRQSRAIAQRLYHDYLTESQGTG